MATTDVRVWDGENWVSVQGPAGSDGTDGVGVAGANAGGVTLPPTPDCKTLADATANVTASPNADGDLVFNFDFGIPAGVCGDNGTDGVDGESATVSVSNVTTDTVEHGVPADVQVSDAAPGDPHDLQLVMGFKIPKGEPGTGITIKDSVDTEAQLPACDADGLTVGDMYIVAVNEAGEAGHGFVYNGPDADPCFTDVGQIKGSPGIDGTTPDIKVGSVTSSTLDCEEDAAVGVQRTADSPDSAPVFDFAFGIPKGCDGIDGTSGTSATITIDSTVITTDLCATEVGTASAQKISGTDNDPVYQLSMGIPRVDVSKGNSEPTRKCLGDWWIVTD